jgi:hypothetical protein
MDKKYKSEGRKMEVSESPEGVIMSFKLFYRKPTEPWVLK